ncbi:Metal homeostasis factor-like protein [Hapsidospora chrysogenum ATCC 11550]|uniref:Metal homeostasis factor-like protein n=1 Tax=Hapsidospora chrysogenum (strain ATCC 11550 / CBS 779.69 / DSM 880 / IAM 14645 / JCM 23072 / IMI 49137) TaxID=857340 RepID=A0A086T281_HAPC1|nr:Metal homeostasis factor-like protein [Hapsidospora chrysogenum ATCC 11550]
MSHKYEFNVTMSCGGCSGAVDRVLKKLDGTSHPFFCTIPQGSSAANKPPLGSTGIESYDVSLDTQLATVVTKPDSDLGYDTVLQKIAKTGKKVNWGKADGEERSVEVPAA